MSFSARGSSRSMESRSGSTSWCLKNQGTFLETGCMGTTLEVGPRQCNSDLSLCYGSNRHLESLLGFQPASYRISSSPLNTGGDCWPLRYFFVLSFPLRLQPLSFMHSRSSSIVS